MVFRRVDHFDRLRDNVPGLRQILRRGGRHAEEVRAGRLRAPQPCLENEQTCIRARVRVVAPASEAEACKTRVVFECFPYVCPEPVLVI